MFIIYNIFITMPANTISETEGLALRAKRVEERGKRPVKVANVSGCNGQFLFLVLNIDVGNFD